MHKSDIDRLEGILENYEEYVKMLHLRRIELEYRPEEPERNAYGKIINPEAQDHRTIKSGGTSSTVEDTVIKLHEDLKYQTLYSIVMKTPKFVSGLNKYERIIYDYRYKQVDLSIYEWEDIAMKLTSIAAKDNRSFSKSTTLRLRNQMLERLADKINHVLM